MAEVSLHDKISSYLATSLEKFIISDFNEAIRNLKAAEVLDRYNPEILYNLGICYSRLGLFKTAIPYFERVLSLPTAFVELLAVKKILAYAFINTGEYERARLLLVEVISVSPSDLSALNMIGYCFEKEGKFLEALKSFRTIIDYDGNNANACNSFAYLVAATGGDLKISLEYAARALQGAPDNAAYLDTMGYIYLKMKNLKKAGECLNKAFGIEPFSEDIKNHLNELKNLQGDPKKTK